MYILVLYPSKIGRTYGVEFCGASARRAGTIIELIAYTTRGERATALRPGRPGLAAASIELYFDLCRFKITLFRP
jgi:hypothetical protein